MTDLPRACTVADARRVCALVPAYNEGLRMASTIGALRARREIGCIVVCDDGSTDGSAEAARAAGADLVITQPNRGKGAALTAAYRAAPSNADLFLLLDADLGASASEAVKLLPPDPDFAASGQRGGSGLVVRLARWGIHRRTGQTFAQPLSGQRGVRRAVLDTMGGQFAPGFGVEVALTLSALGSGYRLVEVPTFFRHHVTGGDWRSLSHRARQLVDVARVVLRAR